MNHAACVNVTRRGTGRVSGSKVEPRQVLQPAANQACLRTRCYPTSYPRPIEFDGGGRGWG